MATILVIDDDKVVRSLVSRYLTEAGHGTVEAQNGREGLEAIRVHRPDLILCDVMMPELDGYQVLETLLRTHELDLTEFLNQAE
ncbi:MAG: response regulator [Alphaproteobacteria bacterium]|nr:response regulator [Alphaproteobacteria bacterium]